MFEAWGRALSRRRRLTLGVTLVLVALAAVWGTGVFGKLSSGDDFTPPASQSQGGDCGIRSGAGRREDLNCWPRFRIAPERAAVKVAAARSGPGLPVR